MAIYHTTHSYDGAKWTVNTLVKNPVWVPNLVKRLVEDMDISQVLLRQGPNAVGGTVAYERTVALYADSEGEVVAEYGEIPLTNVPHTTPFTVQTQKRGSGFHFSEETRTRNNTGLVRDAIDKVKRGLVRGKETALFDTIMADPDALEVFSAAGWEGANSSVVADLAEAQYQVVAQGADGARYNEKLGYQADTLIIHPQTEALLIDNTEVNNIFAGSPLASQQLRYTFKMPRQFANLTVLKAWSVPVDTAIVCQRGYMGFKSVEWPLRGTPLKYDESTQSYTSYFTYRDVMQVDNPKAVCFIRGITSGSS